MRRFILFLVLVFVSFSGFAIWVEIPGNSDKKMFKAISSNLEITEVDFSLDGYELEIINENEENYQKISYWNQGEFLEIGKPHLPRFSRLVAIPFSGEVSLEITFLEDEILSDITIYPRQELQSESQKTNKKFIKDLDFYSSNTIFPAEIAEIDEPAIMRDFRIVNVTINPFQYNPQTKELRIIKNLHFSVNCTGSGGQNQKVYDRKKSRSFESLYKSTIINYEPTIQRNDDFQNPCYLFIYPDVSSVETFLQPLLDWKHQKGFEVVAANTSETGTTLTEIKSYIQNAYDNWENPPEFVCLVGDAGGNFSIPTGHLDGGAYNGEGDQFYTLLEGDDILADVFIGRLSFNSLFEFQTIVAKILNYEKEPYIEQTDWYDNALLVGDPTDSGQSCINTKQSIKEMINLNAPNIYCTEVYDTSLGSWVSQMINSFNNGISYFNYRGFVNLSGFNNSSIENLNNGFMLPVAVTLTCITGDFEGTYDCISEKFLKAGAPNSPKGAIAAIATATGYTHTCFNNCVDAGIFYGIFSDDIYHMGGALNRGKLNLYINYPQNPANAVNQFSYWNNLMGDPGMEIWTGIPQEINVLYDSIVALGANFMNVTVQDVNNIPLKDAWVTILKGDDEIFETGFTDENGTIILSLDSENPGEVILTVTKHNFIPHLGNFQIEQSQVFVNVLEVQIDDDNSGTSSGNGDGNINPGEDIELVVSLKNSGSSTASSVSTLITSESEFITITDDYEYYGNIAPGNSVFSADDFDISIHTDALDGTEIEIDIQIEDNSGANWNDKIYLAVQGASIIVDDYTVIDNDNGILDPSETAELMISLENIGVVDINEIYGVLSCDNFNITVDDSIGYFDVINAGSQSINNNDRFEITASSQVLPGTQINFDLHLYNSTGFNQNIDFILDIGEVTITDPLGPDDYGYYCYDDGDIGYYHTPTYQWIEIDPNYGSAGTILPFYDMGNMGDTEVVNLPFELKFYGESYSSITICSNGWITPGITDQNSFMNWSIPGPSGPSPIIAPFWDDLIIGTGCVCYYYNESSHYFIVEWSRLMNEYNADEETFQVILYDQNYYPTSNGESEVVFQYNVVNNVDQGSYGAGLVNHGQYATVGLEDHTGTIGLEYTYNNTYPLAAKPLENEMALLFTGPPIQLIEPYIVLGDISINDTSGNGLIDYGEDIELGIELRNLGENTANNVSAVLSSSDVFITLFNTNSNYNNITGGGNSNSLTDYSFSVSELCPDGHYINFQLSVTSDEDNWILYFELLVNAPNIYPFEVFVDDGNNHILDPGETADVIVSFLNNGGADAYSVQSALTVNDIYITQNSGSISLGDISASDICEAVFNFTADINAPIQHEATVDWDISADYSYVNNGEFSCFVSQVPVLIMESFNVFPPVDWYTEGGTGWQQNPGNVAGGQIPEAVLIWFPGIYTEQRLVSPILNTLGSIELELEFKHIFLDNLRSFTIEVETTDDGINWHNVWEGPTNAIPPTVENFIISNSDVGSSHFQFSFVFRGTCESVTAWVIDDVVLNEIEVTPHGFIAGNVVINGGTGNIEEVRVFTEGIIRNPDINGDFVLPVPEGIYDVSASLPGYITSCVENVAVNVWETTAVDFVLNEITIANPPENLIATTYFNNVTLNWDLPGSENLNNEKKLLSNKSKKKEILNNRDRALLGYKVYRDGVEITEITNIFETTYYDPDLNAGEYNYFVTAIYDDGESEPSNIETVNVILYPPANLTYQINAANFVLLQWVAPEGDFSRNVASYKIYRDDEFLAEVNTLFYLDFTVSVGMHTYYVTAMYDEYESGPSNEVIVEITNTDAILKPLETTLGNNFPNPFNPLTTISFALKDNEHVTLEIFNIKGKKVRTLIDKNLEADFHFAKWNAKDDNNQNVASGIYIYRLRAGEKAISKKMLLMK